MKKNNPRTNTNTKKTSPSLSQPSSFENLLLDFATNNPHDLLVKITLSDLDVARHYFQTHLPKHICNRLDWLQLKLVDVPMIDEKLTSLHSDLLFFVPLKTDMSKHRSINSIANQMFEVIIR